MAMAGKVLITDDVATNRIVFKVKLGAACYQPLLAGDGAGCLATARAEKPDLILLDLDLPDMDGIEVLRRLRADPVTAEIPVVTLSSGNDPDRRLAALGAGADDCLSKPVEDALLMARLRNLLRASEALAELGQRGDTLQSLGLAEMHACYEMPGTVALIAERPEQAMRWRKDLVPLVPDHLQVQSRADALVDDEHGVVPDIFVIDADLGGAGGGLRLMSELRSRAATRHAAIVLLHSAPTAEALAMAYDMGANDAPPPGITPDELALRLRRVMQRKRRADGLRASVRDGLRLAVIDPLTGLYNRRYALPRLAAIAERARATQRDFAVMVVDLDRFKTVNDHWGHAAGDAVLAEVARRLGEYLRTADLVARIGGEEFLVVLPDCGLYEARATAERLRDAVRTVPVSLPDGGQLPVTVSIGLAVCDGHAPLRMEPVSSVVERADRALLRAKARGRNQVICGRSAA